MGIASMNLTSGAFSEEFTVEASSGTYRLSELTELEILTGLDKQKSELMVGKVPHIIVVLKVWF